jgi:chromosome segregation ATPase
MSDIISNISNIENEIALAELRVTEKEKEASELSIQIQDFKIKLNIFLGEYNSRVGLLYVKLDKLKLRIKEYQHRIDLAQGKKLTQETLESIEEEINETFSQERRKVDDLESEAFQSSEEHKKDLEDEDKRQSLDPESQQELRTLYRKLAKKFHPDFAKDDKQRKEYQKRMAEINEAYKVGDLETLKKYMRQAEREEKMAKETPKEKIERLKEDYETILGIIAKLREELSALKASETYKLKEKVDQAKKEGRDLLEQLAADIRKDIAENQEKLDDLVMKYRKIIEGLA